MATYKRRLKVSFPNGKPVEARISYSNGIAIITLPHYEIVKKDNPPFAKDGAIQITVSQKEYVNVINQLTKYLEDLFLKGMADEEIKNALRNSSHGNKTKSGRNKREAGSRSTKSTKGKGNDSGLHTGSGGTVPSESDREGSEDTDVASSSYP
jgi:hypothetical protein